MILPIVEHPNPILKKETQEVPEITKETLELLDNMRDTMIEYDGIGIAAPQVGVNLKMAIVELDEETGLFELINPEIIHRSGSQIDVEGCLSIPHVYGTVERAAEVTVRYFDRNGDEYQVTATDYLARAFQHEIDHLHGNLFIEQMIEEIAEEDLAKMMEDEETDE